MAKFRITGPDGGTYEVSAPDGATDQDVLAYVKQQHASTAPVAEKPQPDGAAKFAAPNAGASASGLPTIDPLEDAVKSGGAGLVRGGIGLAALPGGIESLGRMGINYAAKKMGAEQPVVSPEAALPTYGSIKDRVEGVTGKLYEPKTAVGRYANAVGEFAPGALFPGGIAQRVLGNVVGPAVVSETAGEATKGTAMEPWARVGGAIAGGSLPNVLGRGLTPVPSNVVRQNHVQTLRNEGVTDLAAGQITGAAPLKWVEAAITDTPLTGARLPRMMERQAEQFTEAALRRAGVQGDRATQDVINQAFTTQGARFDALANVSTARMTAGDANRIAASIRNYERMTPPTNQMPFIREITTDLVRHAGNPIAGPVYQRYRSAIETAARETTDPLAARALRDIRNTLDDAVERGLPRAQQGQWRDARTHYRNLLVVAKASGGAGEQAANGIITPAQLANATRVVHGQRNYQRGQGDYAALARAGEAIMKPMPQSGTAPRMMAMQLGQTVAGGAAGGAMGGDPASAGIGALAPWLIRGAAGRAIASPPVQRYLANQALPQAIVNARRSSYASAPSAFGQGTRPLEITVYPPGDPRNRY